MKKVGLLFGSFNPVHVAHLMIANYVCAFHPPEEIWWVVTPHNPTKRHDSLADAAHRLEMTRRAVAPYPAFRVCDVEFALPPPTYTVRTLDYLHEHAPQHEFYLLIGSDNWQQFPQWRESDRIMAENRILVYPRLPCVAGAMPAPRPNVQFVDAPRIEISSTFIRQAIARGKDIGCFLPPGVYPYIIEQGLYSESTVDFFNAETQRR
jgi:nicotinate-nucleotide adenylyltransferase